MPRPTIISPVAVMSQWRDARMDKELYTHWCLLAKSCANNSSHFVPVYVPMPQCAGPGRKVTVFCLSKVATFPDDRAILTFAMINFVGVSPTKPSWCLQLEGTRSRRANIYTKHAGTYYANDEVWTTYRFPRQAHPHSQILDLTVSHDVNKWFTICRTRRASVRYFLDSYRNKIYLLLSANRLRRPSQAIYTEEHDRQAVICLLKTVQFRHLGDHYLITGYMFHFSNTSLLSFLASRSTILWSVVRASATANTFRLGIP